jgi:uncharacterized protein involved in tolerance to divalent cations
MKGKGDVTLVQITLIINADTEDEAYELVKDIVKKDICECFELQPVTSDTYEPIGK